MARYRKIDLHTWADENFKALSPIPPCGQGLWFFLLTGPFTGPIPGLFSAGRAAMAEALGWPIKAFDKAFHEALTKGMVKADWEARLVWLPKAIKYNLPESPNVITSWAKELDLLPECKLLHEAISTIRETICEMDGGFIKAFDKAFGKPSPKPSSKTMPNQEQEQEQEQEQDEEKSAREEPPPPPVKTFPPALRIQESLILPIRKSFEYFNPQGFTDPRLEDPAIVDLAEKFSRLGRDNPGDFARAVLEKFHELTVSQDKFWRGQPYTPSSLNNPKIFDRVIAEMKTEEVQDERESWADMEIRLREKMKAGATV